MLHLSIPPPTHTHTHLPTRTCIPGHTKECGSCLRGDLTGASSLTTSLLKPAYAEALRGGLASSPVKPGVACSAGASVSSSNPGASTEMRRPVGLADGLAAGPGSPKSSKPSKSSPSNPNRSSSGNPANASSPCTPDQGWREGGGLIMRTRVKLVLQTATSVVVTLGRRACGRGCHRAAVPVGTR